MYVVVAPNVENLPPQAAMMMGKVGTVIFIIFNMRLISILGVKATFQIILFYFLFIYMIFKIILNMSENYSTWLLTIMHYYKDRNNKQRTKKSTFTC